MAGWWTTFALKRTGLAFVAAVILVPVPSIVVKTLVEGLTDMVYEIHWLESVPLIILLFTFVGNRLLNEHHARRSRNNTVVE